VAPAASGSLLDAEPGVNSFKSDLALIKPDSHFGSFGAQSRQRRSAGARKVATVNRVAGPAGPTRGH